jgi:Flp pilus assembly CpaF family ATPase
MTPFAAIAGPLAPLLMDPLIGEVVVNGPADVWVEIDGRLRPTETRFRDSTSTRGSPTARASTSSCRPSPSTAR